MLRVRKEFPGGQQKVRNFIFLQKLLLIPQKLLCKHWFFWMSGVSTHSFTLTYPFLSTAHVNWCGTKILFCSFGGMQLKKGW
jgi:hypothetical protein